MNLSLDLVTAIATAIAAVATCATALLLFMQIQVQKSVAAPHIDAYVDDVKDGLWKVRLVMYPADHAVQFKKISINQGLIQHSKIEITQGGRAESIPVGELSRSIPFTLQLAPARAGNVSTQELFFIKPLSNRNSVVISLHTRRAFLPIKYRAMAVNKRAA
jgi:hypothetical protein